MTRRAPEVLLALALCAGCEATGSWALTASGGALIEEGIPASEMSDGCSVAFDRFLVSWDGRFLEGAGAAVIGEVVGAQVYDLALAGPHDLGAADGVPLGDWDHVHAVHQPDAGATAGNVDDATAAELASNDLSMRIEGTVTCGADAVTFGWDLSRGTKHHCYALVPIEADETTTTAYTIAGERLFATALQDFDAPLAGQPFVDADANGDGEVTLTELDGVDLPTLGYGLGDWDNVVSFADYLTVQTFYFVQSDGNQCTPEMLQEPYVSES